MSFTNYLEEAIVKHLTGQGSYSPTKVYLALGTSAAGETTNTSWGGELSGNGYKRRPVQFGELQGQLVTLATDKDIYFGPAAASWGNIPYYSLWDAPANGHCLAYGNVMPTVTVGAGQMLKIPAGNVQVALGYGLTVYTLQGLLNLVFRQTPFVIPGRYVALGNGVPPSSFTEPGSNYARQSCSWNSVQQITPPAESTNNGLISFPVAASNWGALTAVALMDAVSGGNMLANDVIAASVNTGQQVCIPNQAMSIQIA